MARRSVKAVFIVSLYLGLALHAGAQATSPRNGNTQSTLPPELGGPLIQGATSPIGPSDQKPFVNQYPFNLSNLQSIYLPPNPPPVSDILDKIKEMLGLLMAQSELQKLLDYEETRYPNDPAQKLAHREAALKAAIQGRISACK
jgi:hypothetical protein